MLSMSTTILISFTQSFIFLVIVPVLAVAINRNNKTIQNHKQYNLVMNAECEWRVVNSKNSKITEMKLTFYWKTPFFIIIEIQSQKNKFNPIILRNLIDPTAFSRLLQGIQKVNK